jgi:hypothetical protein
VVTQLADWHCTTTLHDQVMRFVIRRTELIDIAIKAGDEHYRGSRHSCSLPDAMRVSE